MWGQLTAAGIILAVIGLLVWALMKASARGGQMEERADDAEAKAKAIRDAAENDRETLGSMADAAAASVSDTAADAIERMRRRDPKTR